MSAVGDGLSLGTWGAIVTSAGSAPTAPEGTFSQSGTSVTATYTNAGDTGVSRYVEYRVRATPENSWTRSSAAASLSAGETTTVSGLTAGETYDFRLVDEIGSFASVGTMTILTVLGSTVNDSCLVNSIENDLADTFLATCEFATILTYTFENGSTKEIKGVVNEQVGALDATQRAQIYISADPITGVPVPKRGEFIIDGSTTWTIMDVREAQGAHRVLCFLPIERN